MPRRRTAGTHDLFDRYAAVTQRTGVYTARDYASIIRHLNGAWGLEGRSYAGKAAKTQDYLCRQPERYESLADEIEARVAERPPGPISPGFADPHRLSSEKWIKEPSERGPRANRDMRWSR